MNASQKGGMLEELDTSEGHSGLLNLLPSSETHVSEPSADSCSESRVQSVANHRDPAPTSLTCDGTSRSGFPGRGDNLQVVLDLVLLHLHAKNLLDVSETVINAFAREKIVTNCYTSLRQADEESSGRLMNNLETKRLA